MNEPKPFASLSSTLLARKGMAKPAMRPQAYHLPGDLPGVPQQHHDDLGWNDMGDDRPHLHAVESAPAPAPVPIRDAPLPAAPEPPAVVEQQVHLAREFAPPTVPETIRNALVRAAPGSKGKAAFTLRLDASRHFRLRLVCAAQHRSAQQVVTQALDEFLARQPSNEALASQQQR